MKKWKNKIRVPLAVIVAFMMIFIAGCANWDALTKDEQARVTTDFMQEELGDLWEQAKVYVDANSDNQGIQTLWKLKIRPLFDMTNATLKDITELAQKEDITPDDVKSRVRPLLNRIIQYLGNLGVFDKKGGE